MKRMTKGAMRKHYPKERQSLFNAAWKELNRSGQENFDDVVEVFDTIVSELVNDCGSEFYIHG